MPRFKICKTETYISIENEIFELMEEFRIKSEKGDKVSLKEARKASLKLEKNFKMFRKMSTHAEFSKGEY